MDNESKIRAMLAAALNSLLARVLDFAIYDTMSDEELDTAPKGTWPYVVKELRAS